MRLARDGTEERLRLLRVNKKAPTISALMRSLKHVKSSRPYTRDEMKGRRPLPRRPASFPALLDSNVLEATLCKLSTYSPQCGRRLGSSEGRWLL